MSEEEVGRFKGISAKSTDVIKTRLAKHGLRLGMSKDELDTYIISSRENERMAAAFQV